MTKQQLLRWLGSGLLAAAGIGMAAAQTTVYRCGQDGRTFSEKPCVDGSGRTMSVDDSRTAGEREAAHAVAHREARAADGLARSNRQYERSVRPAGAISLSGEGKKEQAAKPVSKADNRARKPRTTKPSMPEGFTAVMPGSEPKKKRGGSA